MKLKYVFTFFICVSTIFHFGCNKKSDNENDIYNSGQLEGSNSDEIVHGRPIPSQEETSRSIVALVFQKPGGQSLCTGTLISKDLVLTAAHCVEGKPQQIVVIFAPKVSGTSSTYYRRGDIFTQNAHWRHPTQQGRGDLAILHFLGDLPQGYQPTNLADRTFKLTHGMDVVLAGYGVTDGTNETGSGILRETHTTIIGQKSPTEFITDGHQSSVCFGDSGGPGFVKVNNEFVQWGIASSVSNHECNGSSIHTSVMAYKPWIQSTARHLHQRSADKQKNKSKSIPSIIRKNPSITLETEVTKDHIEKEIQVNEEMYSLENLLSSKENLEELIEN